MDQESGYELAQSHQVKIKESTNSGVLTNCLGSSSMLIQAVGRILFVATLATVFLLVVGQESL